MQTNLNQLSEDLIGLPTAFVLINTEIGSESDVLKELKKADTMDKLKEIVTWRIRRLDKVRSTLTMIVVEEQR